VKTPVNPQAKERVVGRKSEKKASEEERLTQSGGGGQEFQVVWETAQFGKKMSISSHHLAGKGGRHFPELYFTGLGGFVSVLRNNAPSFFSSCRPGGSRWGLDPWKEELSWTSLFENEIGIDRNPERPSQSKKREDRKNKMIIVKMTRPEVFKSDRCPVGEDRDDTIRVPPARKKGKGGDYILLEFREKRKKGTDTQEVQLYCVFSHWRWRGGKQALSHKSRRGGAGAERRKKKGKKES